MFFEHPQTEPTRPMVAFLLEPYRRQDSARLDENNKVYDEIVDPTVSAHDFRVYRSSELCRPDFVSRDHQRLAEDADLLIVNLSYHSPVVFYCLAWRLSRDPEAPVLALLDQKHDRLIETPVLVSQPVLYDLSPSDPQMPEERREEDYRGRVQNARRDLAKQFLIVTQKLNQRHQQQNQQGTHPQTSSASTPHPRPMDEPSPHVDSATMRQAKEDILRHMMSCLDGKAGSDIVDRLASTLLRTPRF